MRLCPVLTLLLPAVSAIWPFDTTAVDTTVVNGSARFDCVAGDKKISSDAKIATEEVRKTLSRLNAIVDTLATTRSR